MIFHGDKVYEGVISEIIRQADICTVINTELGNGDSSVWLRQRACYIYSASNHRTLSPENESEFARLGIELAELSPYLFVAREMSNIDKRHCNHGQLMLMVGDADFDGLLELVESKKSRNNKFVCIIDGFSVPNKPNFIGERQYDDFATTLNKFRQVWFPTYDDETVGYVICSDYVLDLGPMFKRHR